MIYLFTALLNGQIIFSMQIPTFEECMYYKTEMERQMNPETYKFECRKMKEVKW